MTVAALDTTRARLGFGTAAALAAALAFGVAGCSVQATAAPPADGSVTVDWTIDDAKSGSDCDSNAATSIQVTVIDENGSNAGTFEQACAAFATTIQLPPGHYTANALLVDSSDKPRTTAVAINPFTVVAGTDLNIPIDFPQSSFQ